MSERDIVTVMRLMLALALMVSVVGCTKRNPAVCCTTAEDCSAKGLPEGTNCADSLQCIQNECTAPTTCQANSDCEGPTPFCAPDGTCGGCLASEDCSDRICDLANHQCRDCTSDDECATGFCSPATHACAAGTITPMYLPAACDAPATGDLNIAVPTQISTDSQCTGGIVTQTGGREICVLRYRTIDISSGATLSVVGPRVLAIVADTSISVDGTIDISASGSVNGAGGGNRTSGAAPLTNLSGGGGAGLKSAGGPGGDMSTDGGAANGGAPDDVVSLSILVGGTRPAGAAAGGAGGAATLIACRGSVSVGGVIDAGGGGGGGGSGPNTGPLGGYGGGSGGHVVLQGRSISVTGTIAANGGAGGGGKTDADATNVGVAGNDAPAGVTCAVGGSSGVNAGDGGAGACKSASPGAGKKPRIVANRPSIPSAGGGGGSVGILQTFTPVGVAPSIDASAVSPDFESPGTVQTH